MACFGPCQCDYPIAMSHNSNICQKCAHPIPHWSPPKLLPDEPVATINFSRSGHADDCPYGTVNDMDFAISLHCTCGKVGTS